MPYVKKEDFNMYYEEIGAGNGAPIIFLHGSFSRGILAFAAQMQFFQFTNRCIYPDQRGHGRTEAEPFAWEEPQLADDVFFLMDELGIDKAHLVGHSLGGDVAMYCGVKNASRFHTITSISSGGVPNDDVIKYMGKYRPERIDRNKYADLIRSIKTDHAPAHGGDWETFLEVTVENTERYPDFTDGDLKRITAPFQFIYGELDAMIQEDEIKRFERNISDFTVHKVMNAGHFLQMTGKQHGQVTEMLATFFRGNE